jgi:ABC-2 type transport system permease protein
MALDAASPPPAWTPAQSRAQLAAVAWLRWRLFLNAFRRNNKKRSTPSLVFLTLLRIWIWAVIACFFVGPVVGTGFAAYYAPTRLGTILWSIFTIHLFISVNVMPGIAGFDLTTLLRFPISFAQYLAMRLFFGLFAISTIVATLCLASAAVGLGLANHEIFPWAALVLAVFALHNVFFIRMALAWVDRWMATRRAREIFGAIVLIASLSFQLALSGTRGHRGQHTNPFARFTAIQHLLAPLHPLVAYLPPSLAADAILDRAHSSLAPAYASLLGIITFALVFLAIFAIRLQNEFRGENLSEANRRAPRPAPKSIAAPAPQPEISATAASVVPIVNPTPTTGLRLPPTIAACLQKELIYLKRSGAQLYGLITPIFFVFIITRTNRTLSGSPMLLPYAVSYVMFGLLANLYNVLGADAAGFNLYLLAPVRLRDVLIAKNLVNSSVILAEVLFALAAVSLILGGLPTAAMLVPTMLWVAFALLVNLSVGNLRSLLAPMRFELGKTRRAPMAKGGALISLGVLLGTIGLGIPILFACRYFHQLWLASLIFILLDAAAVLAYLTVLARVDSIAANHREDLVEALCKA